MAGRGRHAEDARIGGTPVHLPEAAYQIRECRECGFRWKSPQLPYEEYVRHHAAAATQDWSMDATSLLERRLHAKRDIVQRFVAAGRVLDVGCWHGDFLACWGREWAKFGIEPNRAARAACRTAGLTVIGEQIEAAGGTDELFDVITLIDVLEHLPDPYERLSCVAERLAPGGALVIETGDTRSLHARVMGCDWYYQGCPEHVSFFCVRALRRLFERLGLQTAGMWRWPHRVQDARHVLSAWAKALTFKWPALRPRHLARCLASGRGLPAKEGVSPWLTGICDHVFALGLKLNGSAKGNAVS